ncbi:unnamed protein product [Choristocarpus tenellus]
MLDTFIFSPLTSLVGRLVDKKMFRTLVGGGRGVVRVAARGAAAGSGSARSMGGHARDVGLPGQHPPIPVSKVYQTLGTAYLTTMFLWMMYRAKEDGMVVLVGMALYGAFVGLVRPGVS